MEYHAKLLSILVTDVYCFLLNVKPHFKTESVCIVTLLPWLLTFQPQNGVTGHLCHGLHAHFQLATPIRSRLRVRYGTDRQTHDSHQWIIPPPYGDDGITSRWLHQTTRQQQQQQPRSDLDLDYRCHVYFSHVNRHRLMYTVRWRRYHQPALTTLHTYIYTHISSDLSQQTRHEVMLVSWLVFNHTFSTNRLYRVIAVGNISRRAGGKTNLIIKQWNNTLNQEHHKHSSAWALWRRSPRHG